jgi:hypothetical protein
MPSPPLASGRAPICFSLALRNRNARSARESKADKSHLATPLARPAAHVGHAARPWRAFSHSRPMVRPADLAAGPRVGGGQPASDAQSGDALVVAERREGRGETQHPSGDPSRWPGTGPRGRRSRAREMPRAGEPEARACAGTRRRPAKPSSGRCPSSPRRPRAMPGGRGTSPVASAASTP